jgi:hypothetical protein
VEVWKLVDATKRMPRVDMKVSSCESAEVSTLEDSQACMVWTWMYGCMEVCGLSRCKLVDM